MSNLQPASKSQSLISAKQGYLRANGLHLFLPNQSRNSLSLPGLGTSSDTSPCSCEIPQVSEGRRRREHLEAGYKHKTPKKHKINNYLLLSLFTGLKEGEKQDQGAPVGGVELTRTTWQHPVATETHTKAEELTPRKKPEHSHAGATLWFRFLEFLPSAELRKILFS